MLAFNPDFRWVLILNLPVYLFMSSIRGLAARAIVGGVIIVKFIYYKLYALAFLRAFLKNELVRVRSDAQLERVSLPFC